MPAINPFTVSAGLSLAGGVYRLIAPDRQRQIQNEVLQDMRMQQRKASRVARGQFTGAERQDIARAAAPGLNRLAGNLAQRGLGTSGAGAQVLGEASVAPYTQERMRAEQQLGGINQQLLQAASMFPPDNSFFDDLGSAVSAWQQYQGLQELGGLGNPDVGKDPIFEGALQGLFKLGDIYKSLMGGFAPPPGFPGLEFKRPTGVSGGGL